LFSKLSASFRLQANCLSGIRSEENGMKLAQSCLIALFAAMVFAFLPAEPAMAEHLRWMLPGYFPPPPERRSYRYYPDPYEDEFYEDEFYDDYDDEAYFYYEDEPRYDRKPRKKKRSTASSAPEEVTPAPAQKSKKKKQSKAAATQTESRPKPKKVTTTGTAPGTATGSVTCDRAKSIVSGYGFAEIQTQSCNGEVFSFAAKRGGKSFAVKVSALNGELTEVKRQ
jgi:hypothetical protein